jgi:ABC-type phosphate transport system substrate-binding protein
MRKQQLMTCVLAALGLLSAAANAEIVVIVNPKNPASALTAEQVSSIYLGVSAKFPGGGAAVLADQLESAPIRDEFYQKATGRSAAQAKAVWARLLFSGKGVLPKELKSDAEVKAFVASNPHAIGYVDSSAVDGSVKAVAKF